MEGIIVNFRRGRHTQKDNQMVISVSGYDKEKAKGLVGKKVVWTSPAGKELKGKISSVHGNKGAVRAIFETGMPGQAIGSKVKIE
ncbi:50S ribosomal protein L35ae [Candidatus Woesearchaeota archaeon]|nr:50S ribosomal protein L35ae [Candidatus Woesearchaeota archaeon]